MRAIWSGDISFGLVNVPVKLYSAVEDHDVDLHQVHDSDRGRIRYERRCEVCGQVVPYAHIDRAFANDEQTIVLTKDDMDSIPQERSREISVLEFVPSEQLDPMLFENSYYLAPTGKSQKAYVLLRKTLERTERTAVVQFALRLKTRLAALRVRDDVLMLQTLRWPDEIRSADFAAPSEEPRISPKEMQLSAALVKSFSSDFTPEQFHDDYQDQLRELIDTKLKQGDAIDTDATFGATGEDGSGEQSAEVIDLMEALKQSVARSKAAKSSKAKASGSTASATSARSTKSSKRGKASRASEPAKSTRPKRAAASSKASKSRKQKEQKRASA